MALASGQAEDAVDAASRTALGLFRELGAAQAMDAAADVLRRLGGGTAPPPRGPGELGVQNRTEAASSPSGRPRRAERSSRGSTG